MFKLFDPDQVFKDIKETERQFAAGRDEPARVRLWDGNWNQFAEVEVHYGLDFQFLNLDAGNATLTLPVDHAVAEALMDVREWPTKSMYATFDKDGARWSGRLINRAVEVNYKGEQYMELSFVHDYIKLKELLVWANPFLLAEVQFPKAWMLFGPARWVVATTLFVNLLRKNNSLWMVPDDPLDFGQWFDLDMSKWNMAVKPVSFLDDSSPTAVVSSRFKTFHDCVKDVCLDAQLTIEARRYLPGDPDPIPGMNLRYGCLVFEIVDKSGWNKETSFFGSMVDGLTRAIRRVTDDGMVEDLDYIERVEYPDEYYDSAFLGSRPEAPWVVLEHGPYTGMESTRSEYEPPGPSQFVTGGSSRTGINEALKASVIGIGGFIGSLFDQSQAGSIAAELLEPLYSDVFFAFQAHKQHDRIAEQGWDFPFEHWVDGADKAYTLSALSSLRKAKTDTRERQSVEVTMNNGAPYWVGPEGHGDFFIGDRVAVHALGMPEDYLAVEHVEKLDYSESGPAGEWEISVGKPEFASGMEYVSGLLEDTRAGLKDLGVW